MMRSAGRTFAFHLGLFALVATAAADEPPRGYRLGFTPFPYDVTLEAVVESRRFVKGHGDIVAFHIEGVPWAECLEDKPFSPELLADWNGQKEAIPDGGQVYLAISPGRGRSRKGRNRSPSPNPSAASPTITRSSSGPI